MWRLKHSEHLFDASRRGLSDFHVFHKHSVSIRKFNWHTQLLSSLFNLKWKIPETSCSRLEATHRQLPFQHSPWIISTLVLGNAHPEVACSESVVVAGTTGSSAIHFRLHLSSDIKQAVARMIQWLVSLSFCYSLSNTFSSCSKFLMGFNEAPEFFYWCHKG